MLASALTRAGQMPDLPGVVRSSAAGPSRSGGGQDSMDLVLTEPAPSAPAPQPTSTPADRVMASPSAVGTAQATPADVADAATAAANATRLFSQFKTYATATDQRSTQAYQEYAKAWGGRVVHGVVEFPPLSIYVE